MDSNEEQYSFIFAIRVALQDNYDSESDIIRELKKYLFGTGENHHNINQTLYGFYQHYGINIQLDTIKQVPIVNNQFFNNLDNIEHIHIGEEDEEDEEEAVVDEADGVAVDEESEEADGVAVDEEESDGVAVDEESEEEATVADEEEDEESEEEATVAENQYNTHPFFTIQLSSNNQSYTFNSQINPNGLLGLSYSNSHINSHTHMINIINSIVTNINNEDYINDNMTTEFQDVIVTLDDNDISNLKSFKLESKLDTNCSICMEQMDKDNIVTELKCTHTYHTDCIELYLKQYNYKCPVCRLEVGKTKYNIS